MAILFLLSLLAQGFSDFDACLFMKEYVGKTFASWGSTNAESLSAEFTFRRGNSLSSGYSVGVELRPFDWAPLQADGVLYHRQEASKARLHWTYGSW